MFRPLCKEGFPRTGERKFAAAASRPSPADRFNIDREEPAKRARKLHAQWERAQKLHEYYDEAVAEIRASLARSSPN